MRKKNFEVGDLFPFGKPNQQALIVKVWTFKEYCNFHDHLMLEYDIDDAWKNWQSKGPLLNILHPTTGLVCKAWKC